ncbi:hypothetical protein KAW38_01365 [Candidatus Micrarchaeota archaeon]|nr:hypothetical protein [Candidatus Micrarchaeota archaeon]
MQIDIEDDSSSANSELRYLTLELMKLAVKENRTFKQISQEYVENVFLLQTLIENSPAERLLKTKEKKSSYE